MKPEEHDLTCEAARGLLPGYLDGELSEQQAAPLREHLLDCGTCRRGANDHKSLSRWFVDTPVVVPDGFAARVARRAFQGDPGTVSTGHAPALEAPSAGPSMAGERQAEILPFVLGLTAAAAVALFGLSLLLRTTTLPSDNTLTADDVLPPWERERLADQLPARADLPAVVLEAEDERGEGDRAADEPR